MQAVHSVGPWSFNKPLIFLEHLYISGTFLSAGDIAFKKGIPKPKKIVFYAGCGDAHL